jgi:hypothetical protein
LDIGTAPPPVVPALSSAGSAPDQQKYLVDDINEPTPCTLLYVKGRTLRTIEVADAIMMTTRIMHGQPIPSECAMVEVTTIREGREFDDLDYPDGEEGIEKLKDAKENSSYGHVKCARYYWKHHSSNGTAVAAHLPVATEGYGPLVQRRIVVVITSTIINHMIVP